MLGSVIIGVWVKEQPQVERVSGIPSNQLKQEDRENVQERGEVILNFANGRSSGTEGFLTRVRGLGEERD